MKAPFSVVPRTSPSNQGLGYLKPAVPDYGPLVHGLNQLSRGLMLAGAEVEDRKDNVALMEANSAFTNYELAQAEEREARKRGPDGMLPDYAKREVEHFNSSRENFLSTIRPDLRPQFAAKVDQTRARVALEVLDFQYKQQDALFGVHADDALVKARVAVFKNPTPAMRDAKKAEVAAQINASDLTPLDKQARIQNSDAQLESVYYAARAADIYRDSAAAATNAPMNLLAAVESVESSGYSGAVSRAGAIGLMQVMPGTGAEIAQELGDVNFPTTGQADVAKYLSDPAVSRRYGAHYLNKQLRDFGGDIEAALIAYNGGPDRARDFLTAGRDWSKVPAETRAYVPEVLRRMQGFETLPKFTAGAQISREQFSSANYTWEDFRNDRFPDAKIDAGLVGALDSVTEAFGRGKLKLTSGYRSPEYNERASFTGKTGQHTRGTAIDIDVSGYSDAEKERLVRLFVASGARGLGHYSDNSLHVDFRSGAGNGPGGLALWYGEKNYKEGKAWFARGVETGLTTGVGPTAPDFSELDNDPGVANVPLEVRLAAQQDAITRVKAETLAATNAQEDARKQSLDTLLQQTAFGVPSQSAIDDAVKSGVISNYDERLKVQKAYDDRMKSFDDATEFSQILQSDPSAYTSVLHGKGYNDYIGVAGVQKIAAQDDAYFNDKLAEMQIVHDIPTVISNKLEEMTRSDDNKVTKWAYNHLLALQDALPEATDDRLLDPMMEKMRQFRIYRDLGLTDREETYDFLKGGQTESQRQGSQARDKWADDILYRIDGSKKQIEKWTWAALDVGSGGPPASTSPEKVEASQRDYRQFFQEGARLFSTEDAVKAYADDKFKMYWRQSIFSGQAEDAWLWGLKTGPMRDPPEKVYPKHGNLGHVPYYEDLKNTFNVLIDERIELEADDITRNEMRLYDEATAAGKPSKLPTYRVWRTLTNEERVLEERRFEGAPPAVATVVPDVEPESGPGVITGRRQPLEVPALDRATTSATPGDYPVPEVTGAIGAPAAVDVGAAEAEAGRYTPPDFTRTVGSPASIEGTATPGSYPAPEATGSIGAPAQIDRAAATAEAGRYTPPDIARVVAATQLDRTAAAAEAGHYDVPEVTETVGSPAKIDRTTASTSVPVSTAVESAVPAAALPVFKTERQQAINAEPPPSLVGAAPAAGAGTVALPATPQSMFSVDQAMAAVFAVDPLTGISTPAPATAADVLYGGGGAGRMLRQGAEATAATAAAPTVEAASALHVVNAEARELSTLPTKATVPDRLVPTSLIGDKAYMKETGALRIAMKYLGQTENDNTETLAKFMQKAGGKNFNPIETAWCATFMNAVLMEAGLDAPGGLSVMPFLKFGTKTETPERGDLVVLERVVAEPGKGHVGFYMGEGSVPETIKVLGGNQQDDVSIMELERRRVIQYRKIPKAHTEIAKGGLS